MTKVGELYAEVELKGAKEAAKGVENLTRDFGFLGNAASGALKILEWGAEKLNEGVEMSYRYARSIDVMAFRNKIGTESFQRLDQAFKQHGGDIKDFIAVYDDLQSRQARWKRFGMSENEGLAFGMLGINPSAYSDTLDLMDEVTQKLANMQNIGDRNFIAGILGINTEYLRIASKGDYNIWNNVIMTPQQQDALNKQAQQWDSINTLVDGLIMKFGTKWKADFGMDISSYLLELTQELNNAADAGQGFWDSLLNVGKVGVKRFTDTVEQWTGLVYDLVTGKSLDEATANWDKEIEIQKEFRKQRMASGMYNGTDNGSYIMKRLMDAGYSRDFSAAMVGGLTKESKLNPAAVGDDGTSFGIAQWHNARAKGLPSSLEGQVDFLINELQKSFGMTPSVANKMSFTQAGQWALAKFENPKDQSFAELRERLGYGLPYLDSGSMGNYAGLAENSAISNTSKQMVINNTANVVINAEKVDQRLLEHSIDDAINQYMNVNSITFGEVKNGRLG